MLTKNALSQFAIFLDQKMGLHYPEKRWKNLEKKLVLISSSLGFEDIFSCMGWLMEEPLNQKKLEVLSHYLTIGETYFFRDNQIFLALENEILPDIINRKMRDKKIQIWSAGCCSGEEPYSIAMILWNLIPDIKKWDIFILGTDVNPEFISKAETGKYKKWSFRTTSVDMINRFFKKNSDETFTLLPEIKKMVKFKTLNLVEDSYPSQEKEIFDMDLIFCHNVLIYFSQEQIKKTIQKLTKTLCSKGWLSISAIEVPFIKQNDLNCYKYSGTYFFKKESIQKKNIPKPNIIVQKKAVKQQLKKSKVNDSEKKQIPIPTKKDAFNEAMQFYKKKEYGKVINSYELVNFSNISSYELYLLIKTYANQKNFSKALDLIEQALNNDGLNPIFYYLQAALYQEKGDTAEAIQSAKKAIFLKSDFMMAYLLLGILEKEKGNNKAAKKNFDIALDLINHIDPNDILLEIEGLTKDYLIDLLRNA